MILQLMCLLCQDSEFDPFWILVSLTTAFNYRGKQPNLKHMYKMLSELVAHKEGVTVEQVCGSWQSTLLGSGIL